MKLEEVKGVGPSTLRKLQSIDVSTVEDLINFLPKTYIDFNSPVSLNDLCDGQFSLIRVRIVKVTRPVKTKNGLSFFTADAVDFDAPELDKNRLKIVWYNQPYMLQKVKADEKYFVFGKVKFSGRRAELINPKIEPLDKQKNLSGIMPVYRTKGAVQQGVFKGIVDDALRKFSPADIANEKVRERYGIESVKDAFLRAHCPTSVEEGLKAQERIALEDTMKEILYYKIINSQAKENRVFEYRLDKRVVDDFVKSLPFPLTPTQKNALDEIFENLKSKRRMNRLLIGDVGSGKTIVALISALYAVKCGYQVAIVAPTEILAEQHFNNAKRFFDGFDINVAFLSGSVKGAERKERERDIESGKTDVVIGTHSVFSKTVKFRNLSFVVIDEQHKFGVAQKYDLQEKGAGVDTLTLTATPIPRSVLMLLYDELQLSEIDKSHKTKVKTFLVPDYKKDGMFSYVRDEAKKGNQAFIVCPKICDSEGVETYGAKTLFEELKNGVFSDVNVALIYGKMKAKEKSEIMQAFEAGDIDVLIATTVVEVGIDIKNATTIAVLNSERFGFATLHQLRGRVGRGDKKAFCFLHTLDAGNPRLKALTEFDEGYKLAELDFTLRGGGDYLGTRQSGEQDGGKYAIKITPDQIRFAKEIVTDGVLQEGFEIDKDDFYYYENKFKDVTVS